jgi:hypothetical protein
MNSTTATQTHRTFRRLTVISVAACATLGAISAGPAAAKTTRAKQKKVKQTKAATPTKTSSSAGKVAIPKRAFDLSRCTYVSDDAVSAVVGSPVVLDTSPGDAGSNTHAANDLFEQCVFNLTAPVENRSRMRVILHVQRNGERIHKDLLDGEWSSPCPAACISVPSLGDSAVVSAKFGDGGGFTTGAWGHLHVLKGTTRVYVAIAPREESVNSGREFEHANQLDPAQVDQAVKLAQLTLPLI